MSERPSPRAGKAQYNWLRLDNAAKIYPAAMSKRWMAIFRVSVCLTETVDPEILHLALKRVSARFPSLTQRLKRGVFWYYLEHIGDEEPPLMPDVANPCVRMDFKRRGGYMFRVRYHENKIAAEFFHVLTDGTGAMCFLKTLTAEYISLKYGIDVPRSGDIFDCSVPPSTDELEDSFLKYARSETVPRNSEVAYRSSGTLEVRDFMDITTGLISSKQIRARAKEYGATVTEYLLTHIILALAKIQKTEHSKKRRRLPVKVCVPVNLRKFYPTHTLRNFSGMIDIGIDTRLGDYTFDEALNIVKHKLGLQNNEKYMNAWMSENVVAERNAFIRATPLFIKNAVMKIAYSRNGDRASSTTLSNLGNITLPPEMAAYVTRFDFMIGSPKDNPVVCACVSYDDLMTLNVTRRVKESVFEREFFTALVKDGIHVKIESNAEARNRMLTKERG